MLYEFARADTLLGAGGATYAINNQDALNPLRNIPGFGIFGGGANNYAQPQWGPGPGSNQEIADLRKLVSCCESWQAS